MSRFYDILDNNAAAGRFLWTGIDPDLDASANMVPPELGSAGTIGKLAQLSGGVTAGTERLTAAFKPNLAFWLEHGEDGINMLRRVVIPTIRQKAPHALVILDGKFNDLGNTANKYAKFAFETLGVDAVTYNPYMGEDSLEAYARYPDRGVFVLCRTSNPGGARYQDCKVGRSPMFLRVARDMHRLNKKYGNLGLVVGATVPEQMARVRMVAPDLPILVPGLGKQGGKASIVQFAKNKDGRRFLLGSASDIMKNWQTCDDHSIEDGARAKAEEISNDIRLELAA